MSDFDTKFAELNQIMMAEYDSMDMTNMLLEEVIERTGNFREGFYTQKKLHELGRSTMKAFRIGQATAETPDEVLILVSDLIVNLRNITATILTEIERLDK